MVSWGKVSQTHLILPTLIEQKIEKRVFKSKQYTVVTDIIYVLEVLHDGVSSDD